jgi:hypothetical protein
MCEFLSFANRHRLGVLEIGPVSSVLPILEECDSGPCVLHTLAIHGTSINDEAGGVLAHLAHHLQSLDLRGCSLSDAILTSIIEQQNESQVMSLSLGLSKLKIRGSRLTLLLDTFRRCPSVLDRVISISLDENGLSVRDIQSLIEVFGLMPQLSSLSLSGNFSHRMSGLGTELCRILALPHLDSLTIRGVDSARLEGQLIPIFDALYANTTLKHLDVSGNRAGNPGLSAITTALGKNATLISLSIDGSEPSSITPIVNFLTMVASSASLVDVPYPIEDIYGCCATLGDDARARAYDLLSRAQASAEARLVRNRASTGIFTRLAMLRDPILDDLIDDIALEMADRFENVPINQHLAINDVVGLPLPFESDVRLQSARAHTVDEEGGYVPNSALQKIAEPVEEQSEDIGLRTLMFNSMLIRRPDAEQRLRAKGDFLLRIEAPATIQESEMPRDEDAPLLDRSPFDPRNV